MFVFTSKTVMLLDVLAKLFAFGYVFYYFSCQKKCP